MTAVSAHIVNTDRKAEFFFSGKSIEQLREMLATSFGIRPAFTLKYEDEDGDWITFNTTSEMVLAMKAHLLQLQLSDVADSGQQAVHPNTSFQLSNTAIEAAKHIMNLAGEDFNAGKELRRVESSGISSYDAKRLVIQATILKSFLKINPSEKKTAHEGNEEWDELVEEAVNLTKYLSSIHPSVLPQLSENIIKNLLSFGYDVPGNLQGKFESGLILPSVMTDENMQFSETASAVFITPIPKHQFTLTENQGKDNLEQIRENSRDAPEEEFVLITDSQDEMDRTPSLSSPEKQESNVTSGNQSQTSPTNSSSAPSHKSEQTQPLQQTQPPPQPIQPPQYTQPPPQQIQQPQPPQQPQYVRELKQLTDMGFEKEKALEALHNFEGNVDTAIAFLCSN